MNGSSMYAGFWRRVAAALLDGLIVGVATAPFSVGMSGWNRYSTTASGISTVVSWLYSALMESSSKQATLGKMALGIRVTDLDGNRITFGKATGRYFAKILSALILGIGFLMVAFTERKQGLHDILAGTLVVKGEAPAGSGVGSGAVPPPPPPPPAPTG
jgi:uncharacterized RDD family membrane protein YckC